MAFSRPILARLVRSFGISDSTHLVSTGSRGSPDTLNRINFSMLRPIASVVGEGGGRGATPEKIVCSSLCVYGKIDADGDVAAWLMFPRHAFPRRQAAGERLFHIEFVAPFLIASRTPPRADGRGDFVHQLLSHFLHGLHQVFGRLGQRV